MEKSEQRQVRALRKRLEEVRATLRTFLPPPLALTRAKASLAALEADASALAERTATPELLELAAELLQESAAYELGQAQDALWLVLEPQLRRVATVGEASQRPRGLEAAAWAHLQMGSCLVNPKDPQHSPNGGGRGGRALHEAIRLGRLAGTGGGFLHAAEAGQRLAQALADQRQPQAAAGVRQGVCFTRRLAHQALSGDEARAFDAELAAVLEEAPEAWCARHGGG